LDVYSADVVLEVVRQTPDECLKKLPLLVPVLADETGEERPEVSPPSGQELADEP
jgi:hypothetical protein